jgi:hypothetical protein
MHSYFIDFLVLITGTIASGSFLLGVLDESNTKVKDVKKVFHVTFVLLILVGSFQLKEILENKKLIAQQDQTILKLNNQNNVLTEQSKILEGINNKLKTKNDEYIIFFTTTEIKLRTGIYEHGQISSDIKSDVILCMTYMSSLFRIADTSITEIENLKKRIKYNGNDSLDFSKEQISFYINSLEVIETNINNTKTILKCMSINLRSILQNAEKLNISNSQLLLNQFNDNQDINFQIAPTLNNYTEFERK